MVLCIKCLLCKPEDLSQVSSNYAKVGVCNQHAMGRGAGKTHPSVPLSSQNGTL